jgi:hypothetical protein
MTALVMLYREMARLQAHNSSTKPFSRVSCVTRSGEYIIIRVRGVITKTHVLKEELVVGVIAIVYPRFRELRIGE